MDGKVNIQQLAGRLNVFTSNSALQHVSKSAIKNAEVL
jgi:hypothetical protein